jgi:transposase
MSIIVGIDVSKSSLECSFDSGKSASYPNDESGRRKLARRLTGVSLAVMEATGRYHESLARLLCESGVPVSVVNPARAHYFAKSRGLRDKTDKADARALRRMGELLDLERYAPPGPLQRELRRLSRHRQSLAERAAALKTALGDEEPAPLERRHLEEELALLKRQIQEADQASLELLNRDPSAKRAYELLLSVPGFGRVVAGVYLSEMGDVGRFSSAKQAAAYAGVCPSQRSSGTSLRAPARMAKCGNARLRRALYLAALASIRAEGPFRDLFLRMLERGKSRMQALGAVMHKLCRVAYGVLKSGRPFTRERPLDKG